MFTDQQTLAICAAHFASGNVIDGFEKFDGFSAWAKRQGVGSELKRLLTSFDALPLVRRFHRFTPLEPLAPSLTLEGDTVFLAGVPIGSLQTWYRTALPQETQARIAYDSLIDRFLAHLAADRRIMTLSINDLSIWLFAPCTANVDLSSAWQEFVRIAFSLPELEKSFLLLVNSVKLTPRGFGAIEFPGVTPAVNEITAAFYLATLEQRVLFGSEAYKTANTRYWELIRRIKDARQKDQQARVEDLSKELEKISARRTEELQTNREQLETAVALISTKIPQNSMKPIKRLASRFNSLARQQLGSNIVKARTGNPKVENIRNSIEDMVVKLSNASANFTLPCP